MPCYVWFLIGRAVLLQTYVVVNVVTEYSGSPDAGGSR